MGVKVQKSDLIKLNVERAIEAYKAGGMVILIDDVERENEGDFAMPAEDVTAADINFMARYGRGLICTPMSGEYVERLELPMMVKENRAPMSTAFTVSVDASQDITTGISAQDRAHTTRLLANPGSRQSDFVMPGHIFPLRSREGGVLVRAGQTEGSVDLARMSNKRPVAVICEIMNEDGSMARNANLKKISEQHGIPILSIADLINYRLRSEKLVEELAESNLPTNYGSFNVKAFRNTINGDEHIALAMGKFSREEPVLVRMHSECLTGDVFHSVRCDCGEQLDLAMKKVAEAGKGVVVYLRQEGRGIGLTNKIKAYHIQDVDGLDTVDANLKLGFPPDLRDYGIGAQILRELGVGKFKLMTNNPKKVLGIQGFGLEMVSVVPLKVSPRPENSNYLATKVAKMGHSISPGGAEG